MATILPGTVTWVSLVAEGDELWHCRLVLGWIERDEYVVMQPDGDIGIEQLSAANALLDGLRIAAPHGGLPHGLADLDREEFAAGVPTGIALAALLAEGAALAATERQGRGLAMGAGGAVVAAAAIAPLVVPIPLPLAPPVVPTAPGAIAVAPYTAPRIAAAGGTWVLNDPGPFHAMGQEVVLPANAVDFGGKAFVTVGVEIVAVSHVAAGTNLDSWIQERLSRLMACDGRVVPRTPGQLVTLSAAEPSVVERPVTMKFRGPRTVEGSIRTLVTSGAGNFISGHDRWVVDARMKGGARSTHEHRVLCKALQWRFEVDGYNLKNSVSFEYLNRRRILLEDAHRSDPENPNWEGAHHWMGVDEGGTSGNSATDALRSRVAAEFSRDSAIAKERRKATEAKRANGEKGGGG